MGLISGLIGHASQADSKEIQTQLADVLIPEETVEAAFKLVRDLIVFTNKRLLFVDKQGMTGKKTEYHTIPYRAITHFTVVTGGHFDRDTELRLWVVGSNEPIIKEFKKNKDLIVAVQKVLATFMVNA